MEQFYDLQDFDACSPAHWPELYGVFRRKLVQFSIEFLQQGGTKPHVVFQFIVDQPHRHPVDDETEYIYYGCRIEQYYMGQGPDGNSGVFAIKLLRYFASSMSAHAAFQFPVRNRNIRLRDLIEILRGNHASVPPEHRLDLTSFDFVQVQGSNSMDGCRDWM